MVGRVTALWLASCGYCKVGEHPTFTRDLEVWLATKNIKVTFRDLNYGLTCKVECPCGHGAFGESPSYSTEAAFDDAIIDLRERGKSWAGTPCTPCQKLKNIIMYG